MASATPEQVYASMDPDDFQQGGGGLFDDVDGVVTGAEFTDELPNENYRVDGNDKPLFFKLSIRLDGSADDDPDVSQHYPIGPKASGNHTVAKDGGALAPIDTDGPRITASSKFGTFMGALKTAKFPVANLGGPGGSVKNLVGLRAHFNRIADQARSGLQTGKKEKKYPESTLCVTKVIELPAAVAGDGGKKPAAAGGKKQAGTTAKAPAANTSAPADAGLAESTLTSILLENGGSIEKQKLALAIHKALPATMDQKAKADLGKLIFSDAFLETQNGWTYDKTSKPPVVTLG